MEKDFIKFLDKFPIEKSQILYVSSDILNILIYHKNKNINFDANYFIDYLFDRIELARYYFILVGIFAKANF